MRADGASSYVRFWLTLVGLFGADQLSKRWILAHVANDTYFDPAPLPVVDGFFYVVNISNQGAAWGMFSGYSLWLAALGVAALAAIFIFRRQLEMNRPILQYSFGLLCGGILGNLVDRQLYGHVVDFLDFHFGTYRYPAFNIADSGITVGVTIYLLHSFRDWWPFGRRAAAG